MEYYELDDLTEIVERSSGQSYHDFVKENQIDFLQLRHTAFKEDLGQFKTEDVTLTGGVHQAFKADGRYIDPIEPAAGYDEAGRLIPTAASSALRDSASWRVIRLKSAVRMPSSSRR